jgi:isoleucyl-tRNA synthetase
MAPYVPFIVDYFYQQLKLVIHKDSKNYQESIHFLRIPKPIDKFDDADLVQAVEIFQKVMSV